MDLKLQLQTALKDAIRSGDVVQKSTLRMALTAIQLAEVEKRSSLDNEEILDILRKEVKSRRDAIKDAKRANRPDLITANETEIVVLENYLPKGLTEEELEALARQVIAETGASSMSDMGVVIKTLLPRLQGSPIGEKASQVVRKLLQG